MRIYRPVSLLALWGQLGACGGAASPPSNPHASSAGSAEPVSMMPQSDVSRAAPVAAPAKSADSASVPSELATSSNANGSPQARLMGEHFKQAEQIRHAVISGMTNAAVQPASALSSSVNVAHVPERWRASIQLMLAASQRVQNAADLADAAAGTADIALACGSCHAGQGGPKAKAMEVPPASDSVVGRMARHSWAMERLWEGLYVPSSVAWNAGARALQEDPFPPEVLERGGVYGRTAASDFKQLAAQAPLKSSPKERGSVYAGLLGTCAACHIATGRGHN